MVCTEQIIDLGTHKLRVVLADVESEYTIILEAGGGQSADAYQRIQDMLARLTGIRVLSYDRSGFGRSELGPEKFTILGENPELVVKTIVELVGLVKGDQG